MNKLNNIYFIKYLYVCVFTFIFNVKKIFILYVFYMLPLHINIICNYTRNDKLELDTCIFIITKLNINN